MKNLLWIVIPIVLFLFIGCSKPDNADIDAFLSARSAIITEIVRIVTAEPSVQGVDKAQQFFDTKKSDLKAKSDKMGSIQSSEINDGQLKRFQEQLWKDTDRLRAPIKDLASNTTWDQTAIDRYNRLVADVRERSPSESGGK